VNAVADRYLQDRVTTATPAELTAMLFDGAVGATRSAITLQENGEWAAATPKLIKAQNIVLALRTSLNAQAGQLATSLDALYDWAYTQLVAANTRRDTAAARNALATLQPIQLAWRESCLKQAA